MGRCSLTLSLLVRAAHLPEGILDLAVDIIRAHQLTFRYLILAIIKVYMVCNYQKQIAYLAIVHLLLTGRLEILEDPYFERRPTPDRSDDPGLEALHHWRTKTTLSSH